MISLIYLTYRAEPKFEWFLDSLWIQYQEILALERKADQKEKLKKKSSRKSPIKLELIFVDGILRDQDSQKKTDRQEKLKQAINGRFNYVHVPPKPSVFQGPTRLTPDDYFVAASCRNTGVCFATQPFIVFVDDLAVLMPKWLSRVVDAARSSTFVIAGAYKKAYQMQVVDGRFISGETPSHGVDSRWNLANNSADSVVKISGGQLYGCTFGLPLEWYLHLNGQNELCDSLGGEDYEFGMRLENHGYMIKYDRQMLTYEAADLHDAKNSSVKRSDPRVTSSEYQQLRKKFGLSGSSPYTVHDMSHFMLELAKAKINAWETQSPLLDGFQINLRQLRGSILMAFRSGSNPFASLVQSSAVPTKHFFTGQSLYEMKTIDQVYQEISEIVPKLEGWCTVEKATLMARLIHENQLRNCVELGVFAGRSLIPVALALNNCHPKGKIFAIDPWKQQAALEGTNDPANDEWWAKLDYDHFHRYTWEKIFKYKVQDVVHLMRLTSSEVVDWFKDGSLDFLHQDANHSEETSTAEVKRWSAKLRSGGFWIFGDTNWETTKKAQKMLVSDYGFKEIADYQTWKIYQK